MRRSEEAVRRGQRGVGGRYSRKPQNMQRRALIFIESNKGQYRVQHFNSKSARKPRSLQIEDKVVRVHATM